MKSETQSLAENLSPSQNEQFWQRVSESVLMALLAGAVFLGGSGRAPNASMLVLFALAGAMIPIAFAAGATQRFSELPLALRGCAILVLAIPLIQVFPLPPQLWSGLPGRELSAQVFDLVGTSSEWHSISVVPRETLYSFAFLLPPTAAFLGVLVLDAKGRKKVGLAFLILIFVSVLVGLIQFGTSGSTFDIYDTAHRGSFLGFFANRNHQGLLMAVGAAFSIFAANSFIRDRRIAIALALLLSVGFLIAAVATLSRAGISLTLLASGLALYITQIHGRLRWQIVAAGIVPVLASLYFISFSTATQAALDRFSKIEENERWAIWEKSWPLAEQYGPVGSGVGSYTTVYPTIEKLEHVSRFYYNSVHNDYLETYIETGLAGLLVLVLFGFVLVWRTAILMRARDTAGLFGISAGLTILLFAIHSIVDYPLRNATGAVVFAFAVALFFSPHPPRSRSSSGQETPYWRNRSLKMKTVAIVGQMLLILGFSFFAQAQRVAKLPEEITSSSLVGPEGEPIAPSQLAQAKRYLARQPLDQSLLNTVYVSEVRTGLDRGRRDEYISVLADLGWRDTPSQQNLLFETASRNDPGGALDHIDGLLRRGKLLDQLLPLLVQFEADPQGVPLLAERIKQDPTWRERYFSLAYPLRAPEVLDARLAFFAYLENQGFEFTRSDRITTLTALARAGRRKELAAIALAEMPEDARQELLFDSSFNRLLGVPLEERTDHLPFEWQLTNQAGISSQIIAEDWSDRMVLRWNGRGAPTIARTMTFLTAGQRPELEVSLSAGSRISSLDALRFTLICQGQREILFVRKATGSSANPGMDRHSDFYQAEDDALCDYPDLYIGGRPRVSDRGADLSIDSIKLTVP